MPLRPGRDRAARPARTRRRCSRRQYDPAAGAFARTARRSAQHAQRYGVHGARTRRDFRGRRRGMCDAQRFARPKELTMNRSRTSRPPSTEVGAVAGRSPPHARRARRCGSCWRTAIASCAGWCRWCCAATATRSSRPPTAASCWKRSRRWSSTAIGCSTSSSRRRRFPGLPGVSVLTGLRSRGRRTPFVLMTGNPLVQAQARRLGAVVLDRPFDAANAIRAGGSAGATR